MILEDKVETYYLESFRKRVKSRYISVMPKSMDVLSE